MNKARRISASAPDGIMYVSRQAFAALTGLLVGLTGLAMLIFSFFDLETLMSSEQLALKVGATTISFEEFDALREISGPGTASLTRPAFAAELLDTLLLAEAGRQMGLDQDPSFQATVRAFDRSLEHASGPVTLTKALFLLEELGRRVHEKILGDLVQPPTELFSGESTEQTAQSAKATDSLNPGSANDWSALPPGIPAQLSQSDQLASSSPIPTTTADNLPARLHLHTIVTADVEQATMVLREAATGVPFAALNASWSISLYRSVGGDIGWKTASDLPDEVFQRLSAAPPGSLTIGFHDHAGVHLFQVFGQPTETPMQSAQRRWRQTLDQRRQKSWQHFRQNLRDTIPVTVHTSLQEGVVLPHPLNNP